LPVNADNASDWTDLGDGQRDQLTPPQAAISGCIGHQLVTLPMHSGGQRPPKLGNVTVRRNLGRIDPLNRLPRQADRRRRQETVPGLPVHLGQPRIHQIPGVIPAVTSAETIRRTRSPSPAVGAAFTIRCTCPVLMS
jgi:hypothetical protein